MFGAFTVWLDEHPDQEESQAPQRGAYAQAEVHMRLQANAEVPATDAADEIISQVQHMSLCLGNQCSAHYTNH
jgi:hypothetical protein